MARRNPGEILFTTAGPNVRPNGRKRRNGYGGGSKTGETALRYAYLWGKRARTSKQFGSSMDEAVANWLRDELVFTSLTRPERVAWESAFNRGWLDAVKKNAPRRNGAATTADPVAARELELYIENEAALVGPGNTLGQAIMRNLAGKILRGTYDRTKAWKAWSPLVDEGAKRYTREFGEGKGYGAFNAATRRMVAVELAEVFEREIEAGGLDAAELAGVKANPRKRKNSMGADAMYYALQQKRIPWSKMTRAQIEAVMQDAAQHGDTKLAQRARAALARR